MSDASSMLPIRFECTPVSQLRSGARDGHWISEGEDPQFVARLPQALEEEGCYRISARVEGGASIAPALYLDLGEGWSPATHRRMHRDGHGGWCLVEVLPAGFSTTRFDPCESAVEFGFRTDALMIEKTSAAEEVLARVAAESVRVPASASTLVVAAQRKLAIDGDASTLHWLRDGGLAQARSPAVDYNAWSAIYNALEPADIRLLRRRVAGLRSRPLVAMQLPASVGAAAIDAVVAAADGQLYSDWALRIVVDAGVAASARAAACAHAARNSRISVVEAGSDMIPCDWLVLLERGQRLRPHALLAAVLAAQESGASIVYWDDDEDDGTGHGADPDFRPRWNPDLFHARGYFDHAAMVAMPLVRTAGGVQVSASADVAADLMLRCVSLETMPPVHVPLVLARSPTGSSGAPSPGRVDAVARHLASVARIEVDAVRGGARVRWPLPEAPPKVSIVVPTRDRLELLRQCVDSIRERTTYPDYEILIVDNGSVELKTLEWLSAVQDDPRVRVLPYDAPFNYARINNFAVEHAAGAVLVLMNNDIEVLARDWLEEMVGHALRPDVGAVGAMLYYPDGTIQHAGVVLGLGGVAGHVYSREPRGIEGRHGRALLAQEMSSVTAACLAIRKDAYRSVSGLDERLEVAFNDIDFCLRLRAAGLRNVWTPFAQFVHHESASRGLEDTPEKLARFHAEVARMIDTWGSALADDPFYHPSLSLDHGAWMNFAEPPRAGLKDWIARVCKEGMA